MNLLILCPHFHPDPAPTGEVMTSIVGCLADRGHRLHVVTSLPWYRQHRVEAEWQGSWSQTESTDWGWITRLHPFPTDKTNIPARALAFGGFSALATIAGLRPRLRPDALMVMSPPLILGLPGVALARRWRAPLVFNIQDVFPDVAVEVGAITSPKVIRAASTLERWLYRRSDAVTVLSEDLADNVARKLGPAEAHRVRVIPNFVDIERVKPGDRLNSYRDEFGLGDAVVITYAGNLGYSQPVELLVEVARRFLEDPPEVEVRFVINGGGSARASLEEQARGLPNVTFVPMQPRERLAEVLASADIHTVLLRSGLGRSSVPSKLYSILAAARPCVASVDPGTEVARVVERAGAGVVVPPGDVEALADALRTLVADPAARAEMGAAGRRFVERWPSPGDVAATYEALFEELITARG